MAKAIAAVGIIILIIAIIGTVFYFDPSLFSGLQGQNSLDVLSVSSINLQQNGVPGANGALEGGDWRILATTGSADAYFLQLNQSTLNQYHATYPSNVQVTGSTTFSAYQTYMPYWYLPVEKIRDVTVYPKITGSYKTGQAATNTVQPMAVTVWKTVPSQMHLIIPFSIGIYKTKGSNLGYYVTNFPGAALRQSTSGNYYDFAISAESIASGSMTNIITFTNPADTKETVKITLQFTVNSAYQFPTEPWVIITEQNGGDVSNNVFHYSDLNTILNVLDYTQGNDWSYYHYMYGGGGVFKGRGHTAFGSGSVEYPNDVLLGKWSDGSVAPLFSAITPPYGAYAYVIDEGYSYPTSNTNQHFQFPGWYTPSPDNNEGQHLGGDFWNYRLPIAGSLHNDLANTVPSGLSIVNYLTQSFTYQSKVKPFTLEKIASPQGKPGVDYWGYGGQGSCPTGIGVAIPKGARQWLFTLDVSTEAVDSIVVVQNYIDVKINNFQVDRDTVGKGQTATITATLQNLSPFAGTVAVGVSLPSSLSYSVTASGGTGLMHFEAAEAAGASQPFTFTLTNTGNFLQDTGSITLTLTVTNTQPRVTDSKTFSLNFLQGLGVPDTSLKVTTQDADTNAAISGLTVQVYYGQTMTDSLSPVTTQDGSATVNLGVYTGYAKIVVTDNRGLYESQDKTVGPLQHGSNEVTFKMILKGSTTPDWLSQWWVWALIVIVVIAIIATAAYAKSKH